MLLTFNEQCLNVNERAVPIRIRDVFIETHFHLMHHVMLQVVVCFRHSFRARRRKRKITEFEMMIIKSKWCGTVRQ